MGRLLLSRKPRQSVVIGDFARVTVVEVDGDRVVLAFEAPNEIPIDRLEVRDEKLLRDGCVRPGGLGDRRPIPGDGLAGGRGDYGWPAGLGDESWEGEEV